ncbi:MAG: TetR/AcrR family transcriptional regulator [Gammaproteobacteria bacterium]
MTPDDRRRQILAHALTASAALGIERARHSDVARAAGVAVSTVFHYFPTREALALAIVEEVARFLLDDLLAASEDVTRPAPQVIETVLMVFCDAIETHPDHVRVWLEWSVAVRGALWDGYLRFHRAALAGIRSIAERGVAAGQVRPDIDLDDAARVVVSLAHMVAQMSFSGASRAQIAHTVHSLVHGYLERGGQPPASVG